ncbi:hypothetical protein [Georgenia sp. SUBG003]|uniref:hypothetical protein n=1 Tax=Georgenia sp. SUBG003 TaxID=1497974 RepID=UPI0004D7B051|nr:hypothetical protein DA06_23000 [Georgenia sp. SUBG003]
MAPTPATPWIRAGLLGLPLYGALTLWASREPQPNPAEQYEAWSRFVTEPEYAVTHVFGSGLGLVLGIFGTFALGAHLAPGRAGHLGMWAMVLAAFGQMLFLFFAGASAFGSPMEGQAYLAGMNLDALPESTAGDLQTLVTMAAILLGFVGNVLLGAAVARSQDLPLWAGLLWIVAAVLMYPFGIVLGALTTGATPPTVLIGAGLVVLSGGWIAWRAGKAPARGRGRPLAAT